MTEGASPSLEARGVEALSLSRRQRGHCHFADAPPTGLGGPPTRSWHGGATVSFDPSHDLAGGDAQVLTDRRARVSSDYSPVMILLTVIAALGVLLYASFLLNPANRGDWLPYSMVIVAETVLILQALLAMWTILSGATEPRDYAYYAARDALFDPKWIARNGKDATQWPFRLNGRRSWSTSSSPSTASPSRPSGAPPTAALAMNGKHRTWILDDGRSDEVRTSPPSWAVTTSAGCPATAPRRATSTTRCPSPRATTSRLRRGLRPQGGLPGRDGAVLRRRGRRLRPDAADVRQPAHLVSRGAGYMQTVFYRFIQPGRNHFNAAFCVGTNVIFRRPAIDDIGGIYTDSKSEDVWTSLMLHERGWRTIYIPTTLAVGDAPETIEAYTKQQLRWATGGFEILLTHNPLSPRRKLTLDQRIMYLVTATHYLTGIAPGLLLLVPPLEIYFDLRPVDLDLGLGTWLLLLRGLLRDADPAGVLHPRLVPLGGACCWPRCRSRSTSGPVQRHLRQGAEVARHGQQRQAASPFNFMIPQVLVFVFLLLDLVRGRLARPGPQPADPGDRLERHQHLHPRRLHRRCVPGRPGRVAFREPRDGTAPPEPALRTVIARPRKNRPGDEP